MVKFANQPPPRFRLDPVRGQLLEWQGGKWEEMEGKLFLPRSSFPTTLSIPSFVGWPSMNGTGRSPARHGSSKSFFSSLLRPRDLLRVDKAGCKGVDCIVKWLVSTLLAVGSVPLKRGLVWCETRLDGKWANRNLFPKLWSHYFSCSNIHKKHWIIYFFF